MFIRDSRGAEGVGRGGPRAVGLLDTGADFPFRPPLGGFQKVELRGRAMWAGVRRSVFVDVCKVFNDFQTFV